MFVFQIGGAPRSFFVISRNTQRILALPSGVKRPSDWLRLYSLKYKMVMQNATETEH